MKNRSGLVCGSLAVVALLQASCAWQGRVAAVPDTSSAITQLVPRELSTAFGSRQWRFSDGLRATIYWSTEDERVGLSWAKVGGGQGWQQIDLPYFPTGVSRYDADSLLIAGKFASGATVLEHLNLVLPVIQEEVPLAGKALGKFGISERRYLVREAVVGRDAIALVGRMEAPSSDLLVQFYDSRDIYQLRMPDGKLHQVTSAVPESADLHVPRGQARFDRFWSGRHNELGTVYVFSDRDNYGAPALVLIDVESDGEIDSHLIADSPIWMEHNLGNASHYADR